jgi:lysophospholipase L1-like esterase
MFENRNKINFVSLYNEMTEYRENKSTFNLEEGHPNSKGNEIIYKNLKKKIEHIIPIK